MKFLADAKTDEILGVHMLGPDVGTMIAEAVRQAAMGVGGWTIQA